MLQRQDVRGGEIIDMDVVADGGAVGCGIIAAEDGELRAPAKRRIDEKRQRMGLGRMAFADTRLWIGPGGVEITQRGVVQAMRGAAILQHIFHRQFAARIGADGSEGGVLNLKYF